MTRVERIVEGGSGGAVGSSDRQACSIVDQMSNLDEVEEDGRVYGTRTRRVVVAIGECLEDFGGKIQPRTMIRGYVSPVSEVLVSMSDFIVVVKARA